MAFALLQSGDTIPEKQLYKNLMNVTKYHSSFLKIMDYEDLDYVIDSQW